MWSFSILNLFSLKWIIQNFVFWFDYKFLPGLKIQFDRRDFQPEWAEWNCQFQQKKLCHRKTLLACMGELKFNTSRNLSISSTTKYFECSLIAFLGGSRWEKTSRLQPGQPDASVSWDNFIFRLNKKFYPGFQGWIWHVVFFPVSFSLTLVTVQPSLFSIQHSFLAYQLPNLIQ